MHDVTVQFAVTPSGVEHHFRGFEVGCTITVQFAVTPSGVEHTTNDVAE